MSRFEEYEDIDGDGFDYDVRLTVDDDTLYIMFIDEIESNMGDIELPLKYIKNNTLDKIKKKLRSDKRQIRTSEDSHSLSDLIWQNPGIMKYVERVKNVLERE